MLFCQFGAPVLPFTFILESSFRIQITFQYFSVSFTSVTIKVVGSLLCCEGTLCVTLLSNSPVELQVSALGWVLFFLTLGSS